MAYPAQAAYWSRPPAGQMTAEQMWQGYPAYPAYPYPYPPPYMYAPPPPAGYYAPAPAGAAPGGAGSASAAHTNTHQTNAPLHGHTSTGTPSSHQGLGSRYDYGSRPGPGHVDEGPPAKKRLTNEAVESSNRSTSVHTTSVPPTGVYNQPNYSISYSPYYGSGAPVQAPGAYPGHPPQYSQPPPPPPSHQQPPPPHQQQTSHKAAKAGPATQNDQGKESETYPPSMVDFVTRCYQEYTDPKDVAQLEKKLAEIIRLAKESNTLWSRDWSKTPIPKLTGSTPAPKQQPAPSAKPTSQASSRKSTLYDSAPSGTPKHTQTFEKASPAKNKLKATVSSSFSSPSVGKYGASTPTWPSDWDESSYEDGYKREARASRFKVGDERGSRSGRESPVMRRPSGEIDFDSDAPIVGTSTALEKAFLRLTERPQPSSIRPEAVLQKSFALMKEKHDKGVSWTGYLNEQMKSIRLDIVVQAIANDFALEVYELNARWCLENDDLAEFKRCLLRIQEFTEHLDLTSSNTTEFTCYALLYHLLSEDLPALSGELTQLSISSSKAPKPSNLSGASSSTAPNPSKNSANGASKDPQDAVRHTRAVCDAFINSNWYRFFQLTKIHFFLEKHILDVVSERLRLTALLSVFVATRPSVQVGELIGQGLFTSKTEAVEWLSSHNCVFADKSKAVVDTKDSLQNLMEWQTKNKPGK